MSSQTLEVVIKIPSLSGSIIQIDLSDILKTERRIHEVALVTGQKAPELLAAFNVAYSDLSDHIARMHLELIGSKRETERRRSVLLLDIVPTELQKRNLTNGRSPTGSEDLRNAVINQDEEYIKLADRVDQITAYIQLLSDKRRSIEHAYHSVKKIMDENRFMRNPNLSVSEQDLTGEVGVEGFGKPRY